MTDELAYKFAKAKRADGLAGSVVLEAPGVRSQQRSGFHQFAVAREDENASTTIQMLARTSEVSQRFSFRA